MKLDPSGATADRRPSARGYLEGRPHVRWSGWSARQRATMQERRAATKMKRWTAVVLLCLVCSWVASGCSAAEEQRSNSVHAAVSQRQRPDAATACILHHEMADEH